MDTLEQINSKLLCNVLNIEQAQALIDNLPSLEDYVYCHDTKRFHFKRYCACSYPTGKWYNSRWNFVSVYVDMNTTLECHDDDLKENAFYCQLTDSWYDRKKFTLIKCEGENVCLERSQDKIELVDGVYYFIIAVSYDNLDDEGRADYHSVRRKSSRLQGIGVELEIDCHTDMYGLCDTARKHGIFAENDGSLDEDGVELIGPIAPFEDYGKWKHWGPLFDIFDKHDCQGHDAGEDYGIHVSLSLSLFNDLDLSKFVLFFNTCSKLCKCVAQRDHIYEGDYGAQTKHKKFKQTLTDKYEAVRIDNVRAEVRIFRSTIRKDRFLKNVEFCEAVRHAVKGMSAVTVLKQKEAQEAFLDFLIKEKKTYPNLFNYLVERKFIVSPKKSKKAKEE